MGCSELSELALAEQGQHHMLKWKLQAVTKRGHKAAPVTSEIWQANYIKAVQNKSHNLVWGVSDTICQNMSASSKHATETQNLSAATC